MKFRDGIGRRFRLSRPVERRDLHLWTLVIVAMVADIGLTLYGLERGLLERNPIVLFGLNTVGYAALAFLKVPALLLGFVGWVSLPRTFGRLNLIGLALPWFIAVGINVWVIL